MFQTGGESRQGRADSESGRQGRVKLLFQALEAAASVQAGDGDEA
jgi:hypothetical protein